ncbi:sigma factor-like helix-turn-helix DNA-binding protein [Arenimonas daejeonensis]|uniref:sigma factor-like helix-turn-helix DNA-binding protein n=1 Tax=Arenimonas daejeonensis TaxID=370777 RepID=UPI0011BDF2B6|nr:sigma factor-like helix-turn-helix DNA-binding protein [Arenimonas daejeonensis]
MSPALSAFLRGIERRAFVFVELQCGDDEAAEAALGRAMRAFRGLSAVSPLSAWPAGFWSLLMAQTELSGGESQVPELSALSSGPRAALLLRIVAGLDFPHAAQVLGVSETTYRFALQRALQQLGDGDISYAALSALRERLHRQVKTLPEDRTASLAALRQRVLQGEAEAEPRPPQASPWPGRLLWTVLVLLALAFAATFLLSPEPREVGPQVLPPENVSAVPVEPDPVTHPDFALLAAPDDEALATELALLSWVASGQADPLPEPAPAADAPDAQPSTTEADDAP